MPDKYRATQCLEILLGGNSTEVEADLEFTFHPGAKEQGPSYASGGQPAEPAHVEDVRCEGIKFAGKAADCPAWLCDWIEENADRDALLESAIEDRKAERDEAADDRYERMRDDLRAAE